MTCAYSIPGEDQTDCGSWQSNQYIYELKDDQQTPDPSGLFYRTPDSKELEVLGEALQQVVAGDGETNYKLVDL